MNVIDQFNRIKHQYKTSYFDIYTYLISQGWLPDEVDYNSRDELWFEYLEKPNTQNSEYDLDRFKVEVYNCKTIIPPHDYVSCIKSNDTLDYHIKTFIHTDYVNYVHAAKRLLLSNHFKASTVKDTRTYYGIGEPVDSAMYELDTLTVYCSPTFTLEVTKHNVYDLLEHYPLDVIYTNPWWDYK
jgi:hypothetical protein